MDMTASAAPVEAGSADDIALPPQAQGAHLEAMPVIAPRLSRRVKAAIILASASATA
jgi:hypothetical protein